MTIFFYTSLGRAPREYTLQTAVSDDGKSVELDIRSDVPRMQKGIFDRDIIQLLAVFDTQNQYASGNGMFTERERVEGSNSLLIRYDFPPNVFDVQGMLQILDGTLAGIAGVRAQAPGVEVK